MRLYLIRHGRQSSKLCNVNVDLSPEGFRQAALVGERLFPLGIDVVYSSDLIRAVQTAQAANLYWNVEHIIRPELREISYGDLEGHSDEENDRVFAEFRAKQRQMTEDLPFPGGECAADVVRRAKPVLQEIAESGCKRAAVVTHGGVIRSMTAYYLGLNLARWRGLGSDLENTSITEFEYNPDTGIFTMERFNDYAHIEKYPELLRSGWTDKEN